MYLEYFTTARDILGQKGLKPELRNRNPVSEKDIDNLNNETDHPMPRELRDFYCELGDGFTFDPDSSGEFSLYGWEANLLSDYRIHNRGFWSAIEEEADYELENESPRVDIALLREQSERRKAWIPFYGFVGGGDVLCLDSEGKVQFYQALDWVADTELCKGFVLAGSFQEFIKKWSKYNFISPRAGWTSFCKNRTGTFDWADHHFPKIESNAEQGGIGDGSRRT